MVRSQCVTLRTCTKLESMTQMKENSGMTQLLMSHGRQKANTQLLQSKSRPDVDWHAELFTISCNNKVFICISQVY